jgi:hypothetical protein
MNIAIVEIKFPRGMQKPIVTARGSEMLEGGFNLERRLDLHSA